MKIGDNNTTTGPQQSEDSAGVPVPIAKEVYAQAIDRDGPIIPPDKRISWAGWITAILVFIVHRRIGLALIIALLVFRQFPTLNLKGLPRKAGSLLKKMRS